LQGQQAQARDLAVKVNYLVSLGLKAFNWFMTYGIYKMIALRKDIAVELVKHGITKARGNEFKILEVLEEMAKAGRITPEDILGAYRYAPSEVAGAIGVGLTILHNLRDKVNIDAFTYENVANWCMQYGSVKPDIANVCWFVLKCPTLSSMVIDFIRNELKTP